MNMQGNYANYLLFVSALNQKLNMSRDYSRNSKYKITRKPVWWVWRWFLWTERHT